MSSTDGGVPSPGHSIPPPWGGGHRQLRVLPVILSVMAALLGVAWLSGCGGTKVDRSSTAGTGRRSASAALDTTPFDSFSDWVSFADQVSVIRVDSERAGEDKHPTEDGRGLPRYVKVSVEQTLWSYGAPDTSLELEADGWQVFTDGSRRPINPERGSRLEVGRRYLTAIVRPYPNPAGGTHPASVLTASSALPLVDDRVRTTDDATPFVATLDGLNVAEIKGRLAAAEPDPLSVKYRDLPLPLRIRAMAQERLAKGTTTTEPG